MNREVLARLGSTPYQSTAGVHQPLGVTLSV